MDMLAFAELQQLSSSAGEKITSILVDTRRLLVDTRSSGFTLILPGRFPNHMAAHDAARGVKTFPL